MSILKMKAVTIAGKLDAFERVVSEYVEGREVHLENALMVLDKSNKRLYPYNEDTEYSIIVKSISDILTLAGLQPKKSGVGSFSKGDMFELIGRINEKIQKSRVQVAELEKKISENELIIKQLQTMLGVDVDLSKLFKFEFLNFRFGRMPKSSYKTLKTYLGGLDAIFVQTKEDETDIWGFYFMPTAFKERVNAVFASLYFERILLPDKISGTPKHSYDMLTAENAEFRRQIQEEQEKIKTAVSEDYDSLSDVYNMAKKHAYLCEVQKKAAHTKEFFYIVGWMSKKDAETLSRKAEKDDEVLIILEEPEQVEFIRPPTKLKNAKIFKPFEFFVRMYGLPSYGEIDPTPILAVTYILLFGIMFGDVGQSAIFAIAGFLIYKKTKKDLAAIISNVGVSGTIFGFVYGSVFGNETLLEHIRIIEPMEKIGFMLMSTVMMGIVVIIFCMLMNMANAIKTKNWGRFLFSHNGVAGIVFYCTLISIVGAELLHKSISAQTTAFVLLVTFLLMFMQEPLSKLVSRRKDWMPENGMFFVESFFEMFDVLLSFVTNTISFLRVGAFAIIHVGMMLVVGVLAQKAGFVGNIVVRIIGNIVVMGLEGLIVGIQVLRLEYYEMFSRYFEGGGREFVKLADE
ncbi:MAG: hypothetical protein N2171_05200 [Clostridia bacterium]|nr:hypothetical protein [Clostridia bacterium]